MKRQIWLAIIFVSLIVALLGCTTTNTAAKTYSDPALTQTKISSIAVLPLQTTKLGPQLALDINRAVVQGVSAKAPSVRIVPPSEAQNKLGSANLIEAYSQYLRDYATSGLINKAVLQKIGDALETDALLQGEIAHLEQQDGYPYHPAYTALTLRYSLVSLRSGTLLWESSSSAIVKKTALDSAPDLTEVLPPAQQKLLGEFPVIK